MSTAFIFKHLLDVLKIESNLDGESSGEIGKEWLSPLLQSCAALRDAAVGKETSNKDRLVILPKVLKCYSRLLNKAVSIPLSEVKHPKLVESILEGLFNLLNTIHLSDKETRLSLQKTTIDEQASVLMIFLHLITIFEEIGKKSFNSQPNEMEDEHLTEISLQVYNAILISVYMIHDDTISMEHFVNVEKHKLNHVFSGPLATQAVQSLLTFCNHKSKRIATFAAGNLLYTLRCFRQHRGVWRTCFPGAFSGLFVLTQSGYKSGSGLLSRVLSALLELTCLVTEDNTPENVQLLTYLYTPAAAADNSTAVTANISGDSDVSLGTVTSSSALFTKMLHKANNPPADTIDTPPIVTPNTGTSSVSVEATDQCLAGEFATVSEYVQWRVQVLQRIQLPLAAAFREVMKLCSPLQRVRLVNQLGALLCNCSAILGSLCVSECLCELLNTMLDTTQIVRVTTQRVWHSVQTSIKNSTYATNEYSKILDALGRKYFTLVSKLYGSVKLCQDVRIKDQLGAILGIGYGVHNHIVNIVRLYASSSNSSAITSNTTNSNSSIIKCISTLYMPDPAVCGVRVTASVLETRNYTYYTNGDTTNTGSFTNRSTLTQKALLLHSVESGYYRVAWRHVQENICKEYADRWALYLGRYGLLEDVVSTVSKQIDKYLQDTVFGGTSPAATEAVSAPSPPPSASPSSSSAVRALHTAGVVGCLRLLGTAVLGLASVSSVPASSESSYNNSNNKNNNGVKGAAKATAEEVCGHCGRKNTCITSTTPPGAAASVLPTKMLRCSRCKTVHYCNKQHQVLDWPTHKLTCKTAETTPPVTKSSTAASTICTTSSANITSDPSSTDKQPPLRSTDVNAPIELLTNASIRIGATTIPHIPNTTTTTTTAAATSAVCVYSAAKREYLIHRSVLLLLQIMQDYLFTRHTTIAATSTTTVNNSSKGHRQRQSVLVVAAAIEGIANVAFSAGPEGFQKYLMKLLYPLLELLVDSDPLVKQAAQCTLQRIALYAEHTSLSGLIRLNLDYIVDKICLQLRSSSSTNAAKRNVTYGNSGGNNASTHLIVDFVFSTLDTTVQDSSTESSDYRDSSGDIELTAPMYLLRDVICDSLHSVDAYSLHSVYATLQLTALLRVLRVLACRAAAAPTVTEFVSGGGSDRDTASSSNNGGGGISVTRSGSPTSGSSSLLKVSKHLQDKIFHKVKSIPVAPPNTISNSSNDNSSSVDISTIAPPATAASFAAQSLLEFTRNLYNLNYEAADLTDTDPADPSADLLNADRIRAEKDRQNEQMIADEHEEEMNSTAVPTASVQLLLDVVHRCCVFLTLPHPASQVIVIETLCAAFVRLSVHSVKYKHHLLPCIHSTWPVVVNRIHELVMVLRSTESHALHRALSTVKNGSGAGAKVKSGSSALLGLESSLSRSSLTDPSCTSDVSVGRSSDGLTAVSSRTRGGTSLNNHYASNTITNSSSVTGAHPSTIPLADQRTQLHVLPHVFDLVAILAVAGREFMTIKLKQELLPELYVLFTFYLQQSITSSHGGMSIGNKKSNNTGSKAILDGAGPMKVLSRSQLLIAPLNNNPTSLNNTEDHIDTSSTGEHATILKNDRANDRHSLHSKIKLSVLGLLTQLCTASTIDVQIVRYMTTQVAPLVYLTLPLLGTQECDEVRAAAQGLLTLLHKLDSASTETLLRCILDSKGSAAAAAAAAAAAVATEREAGCPSTQQALQTWRALHFTTSIIAALNANTSGSFAGGMSAENVLHMYHNDSSLLKQLHWLLSSKAADSGSERKRDDYWSSLWMQKLALWSTV